MSPPARELLTSARLAWSGLVSRRRRWLAAACVALATAAGLHAVIPRPGAERTIWVAATDLPGGSPLSAAQIRPESVPVADVPTGAELASDHVTGEELAAPVRAGQPLTDWSLLDTSLLDAIGPNDVAVAIHVPDAATVVGVAVAGDDVGVFAADASTGVSAGSGREVGSGLRVLAAPSADVDGGGVVIVAAPTRQAARISAAEASSTMTVVLQPPAPAEPP